MHKYLSVICPLMDRNIGLLIYHELDRVKSVCYNGTVA